MSPYPGHGVYRVIVLLRILVRKITVDRCPYLEYGNNSIRDIFPVYPAVEGKTYGWLRLNLSGKFTENCLVQILERSVDAISYRI